MLPLSSLCVPLLWVSSTGTTTLLLSNLLIDFPSPSFLISLVNTLVNTTLASLFPGKDTAPAFAVYRFVQCITTGTSFFIQVQLHFIVILVAIYAILLIAALCICALYYIVIPGRFYSRHTHGRPGLRPRVEGDEGDIEMTEESQFALGTDEDADNDPIFMFEDSASEDD